MTFSIPLRDIAAPGEYTLGAAPEGVDALALAQIAQALHADDPSKPATILHIARDDKRMAALRAALEFFGGGEVATIIGFGELITRFQGVPRRHMKAHLSKLRLSKKDYKLSRSSACRLFDLLAFDDVPVWVARKGKSLQISADPRDQQVLANFANILRGKRFR